MRLRSTLLIVLGALAVAAVRWLPWSERVVAQQQPSPESLVAKVAIPFVAEHCIKCHSGAKPKGDLSLTKFTDEKSVVKERKIWENVVRMVETGEMPPANRPQPKLDEKEAFVKTLDDLFLKLDGQRRDPGKAIMRRLNKAEYANTVRDLLGIDFNPTGDFPNDDVAGGFDNNADVLTLSPILMERYLDAAESVLQIAFPVDGNWPAPRRLLAPVIQPPPEKGDQRDPRMLRPGKKLFYEAKVNADGEYVFRVYGWHIDGDWGIPKIDMEIDDKVVKTFVSTGGGIGQANFQYARAKLTKGSHKLSVSWPVAYLEPKRRETFLKSQADAAKIDDARNDVAKNNKAEPPKDAAKKFELTPDFEPGYHMRWFEFAGPGITTAAEKEYLTNRAGLSPKDAAREVLARFATRAFRRPVQPAEVDRFLKLTNTALDRGQSWDAAIRLSMQAVLISPKFLYRMEPGDRPGSKDPYPIDDYQLASRLSYFLWSSMPDAELLGLAAKKELHKNVPAQVDRMLKDKKIDALAENFAAQWLHLRLLQVVAPDKKAFPDYDESLRQAMLKETLLFFDSIVRENRSILDLLDADYTFLNDRLAKHYGIIDTKGNRAGQMAEVQGAPIRGPKFVRVELQGGQRGGILTQASILTVTSNPTRTNPVKRGKWVLEQILNAPPPPPPPEVPELPTDEKAVLTGSLRQRLEKHRSDAACAHCHARMDPLGFAFENFDGIGAFRLKDGDFDVDASGELPNGQKFQGAGELKTILKAQPEKFARSFAEKLLSYALGRQVEYADRPAIEKIVRALSASEYRFSTLVTELVQSDPFRMRRGKD